MTASGAVWLGLSTIVAAFGLALGVPFWLTATAFFCSILPVTVGMFMRGSTSEAQAAEIESALWIGLATAGAASTGGATAVIVVFGVAIGTALMSQQVRLTLEISAFAVGGLMMAIVAGSAGSWMNTHDAAVIATGYGLAAVILIAVMASVAVTKQRTAPAVAPLKPAVGSSEACDPARRLRELETQLRSVAAAEQRAREEAAEAREKLDTRTTFFAQTSHELRTPLNAIVGFAEMMSTGVFGPLPERYQEYAELIHEGGRNLTLIVDDVLDLARLEAGRYEIFAEPVGLTDLAEEAVRFMADEAARKKVDLRLAGQDDAEAFADAKAVRQIALNLISNALKFTPAGGQVEVVAEEVAGGARLVVIDTGVGISPEELQRLSRVFEQGEAGKKQKGAGLGLSVVRAFADLHGGRLGIESREGGGARISVFFPAEPARETTAAN